MGSLCLRIFYIIYNCRDCYLVITGLKSVNKLFCFEDSPLVTGDFKDK